MPRRHDPNTPPQPPPDAPEETVDPVDLGTVCAIVTDSYLEFHKAEAGLKVLIAYLSLEGSHIEEADPLHPNDLMFVCEDILAHFTEMKSFLNEAEAATNILTAGRSLSELAPYIATRHRGWHRLRRFWAASEPEARRLLLRCARLVQRSITSHAELRRCFERLEGKRDTSTSADAAGEAQP